MSEPVQPAYALRPYQRQVFHDLMDAVLEPHWDAPRVVAHLPTGAGKTRIACHVASSLLNQRASEGKIVVWLASSEELCEQAAESLVEAWTHVGNREVTMHRYWGAGSLDTDALNDGFLVASLPKLWAVGMALRISPAGISCLRVAVRSEYIRGCMPSTIAATITFWSGPQT